MSRTLIIFEFRDEVESFVLQRSVGELRKENVCVLALMPESQAYLKQLRISFYNSLNFFGKDGHEHVLLQSDKIYKFCEPFLQIEDDLGVKDGYRISLLLYARTFIHYVLWLIEIIERACIELHVEKVICCSRDNRHIVDPFLSATEGYIGEVGAKIARKFNMEFELFSVPKGGQGLFLQNLKKCIQEITKYFIYQIKISFLKFQIKNKKVILTTSRSYNLGRILDAFKCTFNDSFIVYLNNIYSNKKGSYLKKLLSSIFNEVIQLPTNMMSKRKRFFENIANAISKLEKETSIDEVFTYREIVFKDLAFEKIWHDIVPYLCEVYSQSVYILKLLKKYQPTMIISQMARDINYNLGELATLCKIPSLLISHGSHVPPENEYEMIEWKEHGLGLMNTHYKFVAVQSPWAKAYLDKIPTQSIAITTGPLLFAKIDKDNNKKKQLRKKVISGYEDKIILLYADTPRLRESLRFYVYQTVDEYINNLNSLIRALENLEGFHLIIRLRPKSYLSEKDLKTLLIDSDYYSIHTEGKFEDYLSLADMLISYSSTTIEEALQNKVPVLLYDPHGKYCHIKNAQTTSFLSYNYDGIDSCYFVNSEENLLKTLKYFKKNYTKEIPDSRWKSHIFDEDEKVNLQLYFSKNIKYTL